MKGGLKLFLLLLPLAHGFSLPALAQGAEPPAAQAEETIWEYFLRLTGAGASETVADATAERVAARTTATASPEGFAGRVNDAISDFLPFFQFAVNSISTSDDERSVTVKLNPFDLGALGPVSVSATATEPQVFDPFAKQIAEPAREAEVKALLAESDDFGDVTWTAEYGYSRPAVSWNRSRKLFGRDTENYRPLIQELLTAAIVEVSAAQADLNEAFAGLAPDFIQISQAAGRPDVRAVTFGEIRSLIAAGRVSSTESQILARLQAATVPWAALQDEVTGLDLARLPALIDNQPQIVVKGTFRQADDAIGPDTAAVTLSYEMGTRNLNAVLREYRALRGESVDLQNAASDPARQQVEQGLRLQAFHAVTSPEDLANEDRYVFSLTYKDTGAYDFSRDYTETVSPPDGSGPVEVARNASLTLPGSTEWVGRFTWTRFLHSRKLRSTDLPEAQGTADLANLRLPEEEEKPRLSLTLERFEVSGNPQLQDRTIGRLTLTLPAPGNMTLPISITYADKSELLGEQDKTFGAHVGISYKINRDGD